MKWNPQYRWLLPQDASSPSLLEAPAFREEKGAILLLLPTTLPFSLPLSLSLHLFSFLMRGDVDSLLGSNFYGDASSNISGLRLLALVFDERTSWSILSDGRERPARPLLSLTVRSIPSHFAVTCLYLFDRFLRLLPPPPLHRYHGSTSNASHSKIIRIRFPDPVRVGPRRGSQIMIQDERRREIYISAMHGTSFIVEWMNEREIFIVLR